MTTPRFSIARRIASTKGDSPAPGKASARLRPSSSSGRRPSSSAACALTKV
ncbi:MAG TPA: hypothetical protein VJT67_05290 [Longimicrobiaceae bacterium]|nr:hypothetical protein [Longimicrobiaceae bacterium]